MYALALVIGFPLPFSIAVVSPAWLTLLFLPLAPWIKRAYADQTVWFHVANSLKVMMCQETLVVVYPAFFYVFTTVPTSCKTVFALLLPIIKLLLRNVMANAVVHLNDDIPEVVILNVEVFSALFVAYCMQNTPSVKTTFVLMAVDALQMSASLYDISHVIQRMKTLRKESEARRALLIGSRRQSVEFNLAQAIFNRQMKQRRPSSSIPLRLVSSILKLSSTVHPVKPLALASDSKTVAGPSGRDLSSATTLGLEFEYVQKLRKVLYITEFVVLLNYVDVVIPCIFCE
ncbi:hypothetical protein PF005_g8325 [Phytophthora fragariae]|nr:hypothetical protein PF005_g8325 [Phytophthora fragariae]